MNMKQQSDQFNHSSSSIKINRDKLVDQEEQEHIKAMNNSFGVSADDFKKMAFPYKLYDLLQTEDPEIVQWLEHGSSFRINDVQRFANTTSPRYFKHTKMESFQRQLNLYGFRRVIKGDEEGAYFHSHFLKGRADLLPSIRRIYHKPSVHDQEPEVAPSGGPMDWSSYAKPSSRDDSTRSPVVREKVRVVPSTGASERSNHSGQNHSNDHFNSIDLQDAANLLVGVYHSALQSSESARKSVASGSGSGRKSSSSFPSEINTDRESPLNDERSSASSTSTSPHASPERRQYDPLESLSRAALIHSKSQSTLAPSVATSNEHLNGTGANNSYLNSSVSYADMMRYQQQQQQHSMMSQFGHPYMNGYYRHPEMSQSTNDTHNVAFNGNTTNSGAADSPSRHSLKSACTDSAGSSNSRNIEAGSLNQSALNSEQVKNYENMMREAMQQQEIMYQQYMYQMRLHHHHQQQQQQQGLASNANGDLNSASNMNANSLPQMYPIPPHMHSQYVAQQQQQHLLYQQFMRQQLQHGVTGPPSTHTTSDYEEVDEEVGQVEDRENIGECNHAEGMYATGSGSSGRTSPMSSHLGTSVGHPATQSNQPVKKRERDMQSLPSLPLPLFASNKLAKV